MEDLIENIDNQFIVLGQTIDDGIDSSLELDESGNVYDDLVDIKDNLEALQELWKELKESIED